MRGCNVKPTSVPRPSLTGAYISKCQIYDFGHKFWFYLISDMDYFCPWENIKIGGTQSSAIFSIT